MGIGISVHGHLTLNRGESKATVFQSIKDTLPSLISDPLLARTVEFGEDDSTLQGLIHPLSEPIEFVWEGKGRLVAMTKTSTLGPGYHAWVIDVLKELAAQLNIRWDWAKDESPYSLTGDFVGLQREMADHLAHLATMLLKHGDTPSPLAVNLSMGIRSEHQTFAITPLGPRERSWWERATDSKQALKLAPEFYGWWNREHDATARMNLGLGLMWSVVRWRPPEDDAEAQMMILARDAVDSAISEDPSLSVPAAELNELSELLDLDEDAPFPPPPSPAGIGYLRHPQCVRGPGGWSIQVPGYFYVQPQEDNEGSVLHYDNRSVHFSAYGLDPRKRQSKESVLDDITADYREKITLHHAKDEVIGRAYMEKDRDEEWEGFILQGWMVGAETFAYVTITFTDESDRQWAIDTWRSLVGGRAPNED